MRVVGDMKRDDIGGGEEFRQGHISEVERAGEIIVSVHIKSENFHAEPVCHADNMHADMSAPDDADGLAGQIKAAQIIMREGARFAYALIGVYDAPRECEEEGESKFGDGILAVEGDIRHSDTPCGRRYEVYMVKAGRARRDELQSRESLHLVLAYL